MKIELGHGNVSVSCAIEVDTGIPLLAFTIYDTPPNREIGELAGQVGRDVWQIPNSHTVAISIPKIESAVVVMEQLALVLTTLCKFPSNQQEPSK